jgi:predicted ATPase/tRNA A-37 threonylcarbamoyl transferase component Bud32/Tfp pilus assembly protein PilF
MALLTGSRFGAYQIISLLGSGGMGEVYLAEDTRLLRKVAIKFLPAASMTDEQAKTRLLREARAAASLDHHNICAIFEVGEAQGRSFIVMQYVEGETLAAKMTRERVDVEAALAIAIQVAAALDEAHRHSMVHRDIKPQNIMLTASGHVKVLDFGLAQASSLPGSDEATGSPLTATGSIAGTVPYMSPEQLRGGTLDSRSDIFSFGTVLHELITGEHPFSASSAADTISAILTREPPPIQRDTASAPGELQRIARKCLEKDRERRYHTTRDLLIDLESIGRRDALPTTRREQATPASLLAVPVKAPNLPTARTPLVGRDHERLAARSLLLRADVRLVTFTGAGGTGKTRLALQIAADVGPVFNGRVYFVALASISDPALVVPTIAQALSAHEIGGRDPTEALRDTIAALQEPVLLVLDNFEQVLDAAPLLTELLESCANLKMLVTSRAVLRVYGEHDFDVPSLRLPPRVAWSSIAELARFPAVALFLQRAAAVKPDFALTPDNCAAVAEICAKLDGLPLAIELAAARVRMLTPAAMLQRLESRFELLTGGARDLPARQQTLRATVEWSYGLLAGEEQKLFRRLAVFVNGCTLEAAEAVCNASEDLKVGVLDAMESLVGQSLVQQIQQPEEEVRFAMLETMREYGVQRLAASPDEAVTRRAHAAYCLVLAEEGGSELTPAQRAGWLARCDLELDNYRAALEWATRTREVEWGLRLGAALHPFWHARGHYSEGRERLGALLRLPSDPAGKTRSRALNAAAYMATSQSDFASARALTEESLAICRNLRDTAGVITALNTLAFIERILGSMVQARTMFEECLKLSEATGDDRAVARALINLGQFLLKYQNDPAAARPMHEKALSIFERLNSLDDIAMALSHLGDVARHLGDPIAAQAKYERALAISRGLGDRWAVALTLVDLGELMSAQGEARLGLEMLAQALGLVRELGYRLGIARVLDAFARSAARRGHAERALRLAGAADAIRGALRAPLFQSDEVALARALDPARQALGTAASAVTMDGRSMSIENAIEYALSGPTE